MDRDPSGSRGAEVIDITPYINGETPRDIGKVVYASFSRGGSKQKEGLGSSEKAPVYDIFSGTTQEDRLREQLDDAHTANQSFARTAKRRKCIFRTNR